jgi:NADH-quinone oxidoreductase subunit M
MVLLPFIAAIVFCGVYPKPMLDRIQPSVKALIAHISEKTGYVEPQPALKAEGAQP